MERNDSQESSVSGIELELFWITIMLNGLITIKLILNHGLIIIIIIQINYLFFFFLYFFEDTAKGSFYANPQYDIKTTDAELLKQHLPYLAPNVWPTKDLPEFEPAYKALGNLIIEVGKFVGKVCDSYGKPQIDSHIHRCSRHPFF